MKWFELRPGDVVVPVNGFGPPWLVLDLVPRGRHTREIVHIDLELARVDRALCGSGAVLGSGVAVLRGREDVNS